MNKPLLSIFLGGIRPFLWERLYSSISQSCTKYPWELVICGPYSPPKSFANILNFKYIRDFGNVSRGAQIASIFCEGRLITLGADDGVYLPDKLTKALDFHLYNENNNNTPTKVITALKYMEGGNLLPDNYFKMYNWFHFVLPGVPSYAPMMLNSIISKEKFREIGGYDCEKFHTCNWGGQDLTLRLLNNGCHIYQFPEHILACDHTNKPLDNGMYNDHKPIDIVDDMSSPVSDYKIFYNLYKQPSNRSTIDFDNWKNVEQIWSLRFNDIRK
jgi:hypothetical protein